MTRSRRYNDGCAIAAALDLVGERWALLVARELLLGPKRFTDLQEGLPGVGPKVLAQRLRQLETDGVVRRRTLPPPASSKVYELTERGARLEEVVVALGRWGADAPARPDQPVSADSVALRFRTLFRPATGRPWTAVHELRLGPHRFTIRVVDGTLTELTRGEPRDRADTIIDSDPGSLSRALNDPETLASVIDAGRLSISGDVEAGRALLAAAHPQPARS